MRHLHRDYNNSHCGLDAAHILMTHEASEADCQACLEGLVTYNDEQRLRAEEEAAHEAAIRARRQEDSENRQQAMLAAQAEQEQRLQNLERAAGIR